MRTFSNPFDPGAIVSSFYYYYDAKVLADAARVLGKSADAALYDKLAAEIRAAFNREFYDPKTGNYADGTQTANTLALFLELPTEKQGGAWGRLFDDIVYKHDSHLTTGIIGTKYIMELLTRSDQLDLAYDIAVKTDYPSWGYMIKNGATTLGQCPDQHSPRVVALFIVMFQMVSHSRHRSGYHADEQVAGDRAARPLSFRPDLDRIVSGRFNPNNLALFLSGQPDLERGDALGDPVDDDRGAHGIGRHGDPLFRSAGEGGAIRSQQ